MSTSRSMSSSSRTGHLVGAFVSVAILLAVFTGSFWLASMGLLGILFAFGIGLSLYRFFSSHFGILSGFAFFLLLGIACDDIFVLFDAWRQSTEVAGIAMP